MNFFLTSIWLFSKIVKIITPLCRPACLEENYPAASVSSVKWPNEKHQVEEKSSFALCSTFQSKLAKETAAQAFGMDSKEVAENLVKINVYYTSLNEKTVQDEIVYSMKVKKEQVRKS